MAKQIEEKQCKKVKNNLEGRLVWSSSQNKKNGRKFGSKVCSIFHFGGGKNDSFTW